MKNELTLPQRAAVALNTAEHEAQLIELAKSSADIVAVANAAGRDQAHRIGMTLRTARTNIAKVGKAARDDATAYSKAVIAEETRLVGIIEPEEKRVIGLRDKWDAEVEAERQAKIAAERARIESIQLRINEIKYSVLQVSGKPSIEVQRVLDMVREITCTEAEFDEFAHDAMAARSEAFNALEAEFDVAVAREAEAARQQAEREAAAAQAQKEREELAAAQAKLKADQEKAAAEQAALRAAFEKNAAIERAAIAEQQRIVKAAQDAVKAEQDRIAADRAQKMAEQQAAMDDRQRDLDHAEALQMNAQFDRIAAELKDRQTAIEEATMHKLAAARALEQETATVAVVESAAPTVVEMVTITKAEYDRLLNRAHWLSCLEYAGVDNWGGIDFAREIQLQDQDH